jgi:peptidoglycan hydrolase-like protein with peptidoglycan-binding domain
MTMPFNKWLQSRLTAHGYPVGAIDGRIGETTLRALKAFEKAHDLTMDGFADPFVVQALRATASAVPPAIMVQIPNRDTPQSSASAGDWPRQADVSKTFGKVGTQQTSIELPFDMVLAWDKSHRVRKITLHQKVAASASRVFDKIAATYSTAERGDLGLNIFGGSLNVRKMRGGNSYSMHSWGIAIDFDPERNGLHVRAPQARLSHEDAIPFWKAWEAEGWLSLGRSKNFDWMHVQAARL